MKCAVHSSTCCAIVRVWSLQLWRVATTRSCLLQQPQRSWRNGRALQPLTHLHWMQRATFSTPMHSRWAKVNSNIASAAQCSWKPLGRSNMGVQAYCVFWHQQLHANSVQTAQCPRTAFCSTQLPNNNQCRVPTMPACRTSCRPGQHALSCQHIQHVSA